VSYLVYGANGYTGALIAREAARRGQRPVLAGRDGAAVGALAAELGLAHRRFGLDDAAAVAEGLEGVTAVLHCAGPFAVTAPPMMAACLRRRVHYLDITGEIEVFEGAALRHEEARRAGVMLLPGAGFDVVPSDCLAAHLKRRLPTATHLTLGLLSSGRLSRGTLTTTIEHAHRGGLVRRGGVLTRVPSGWKTRRIDFGRGERPAVTIPWGDVSTAFHSTGIPNIEVYIAVPASRRTGLRLMRWATPLLRSRAVKSYLTRRVRKGPPGPTAEERARGRTVIWGEVTDEAGGRAVSRLIGPEGYAFTVATALAAVERAESGQVRPGFQTPSKAYGADFVLEIPGVERLDA
jgi:short subunit dehydrogenase-like uncharacterized protein